MLEQDLCLPESVLGSFSLSCHSSSSLKMGGDLCPLCRKHTPYPMGRAGPEAVLSQEAGRDSGPPTSWESGARLLEASPGSGLMFNVILSGPQIPMCLPYITRVTIITQMDHLTVNHH